jgi:bifunctional non-homologous end joining protein LigD
MSLQRYHRKRDFAKTPEPEGGEASKRRTGLRFVVQKHAARSLHYDFRLELDGTLKSWAVPKGPSLDPADRRLAMHVEDHPLDYGDFEGVIPEKQYGAGAVVLWDRGTWIPEGDPRRGYREGHLKFALSGKKLRGGWALVRMKGRGEESKEPWLLIKERDAEARPGHGAELLEKAPESVKSRRTVEEIAAGRKMARPRAKLTRAAPSKRIAVLAGKPVRALPTRLEPELATLVATAPTEGGWLYEVKYDGYRILARIDRGKARLYTRYGHDWTARFAAIARDLEACKLGPSWLDGEVGVLDARGRTSFSALQRVLSAESDGPALYFIFDAPFLAGRDLRSLPLTERRDALERALGKPGARSMLRFSASVAAAGAEVHAQACKSGLEGVMGKRADSPYRHERTRDWIKLKCRQRQEFVIGGYTAPRGSRQGLGALLLGVHEKNGELRYAGLVGTGMDDATLTTLAQKLSRLRTDVSPFARSPSGRLARGVQWVRPRLVGEVSFAEWTHDGNVRQASFEGLREDKPEAEVEREVPRTPHRAPRTPARSARARVGARSRSVSVTKARASAPTIAGVKISHPERVVYPDAGVTKLMVAEYYERVAPRLLPYVTGRPLSIVRCPEGANAACFFQKHVGDYAIPGVEVAMIDDSTGRNPYIVANTAEALVGLAQMNALELHVWGARVAAIERPDSMVLDLDPDPALPWASVVAAAKLTRALLDELGLDCLLKTTGGKGLHVVVPLRRHGWDEVKDFAQGVAAHLAKTLPDQFTATMSKARRSGKIFVDYLRNTRGATAVAPYSLRARPGATVATPLSWDELSAKILPGAFTIATVPGRIAKKKDPWAGYEGRRQRLTAAMLRALR